MANRDVIKNLSAARVTSASTSYVDALTATGTPTNGSKDFWVICSALVDKSATTTDVNAKLIDSTGVADLCVWNIEPQDTTDLMAVFGLAKWTSPASPVSQSFKLQYSSETSGTAGIGSMAIVAIESATGDQYIGDDASTTTTSATMVAAQTLTFTPATTGDYLIIAYAEVDAQNVGVQLDVDGTDSHIADPVEDKDATTWSAWSAIHKVNLTAVSHTIKIEFRATAGGTAELRRRRILAIRLDTLKASSTDYTSTRATTVSTTAVDAASTTFTAAASVDYFAIGNVTIDGSSTTISTNAQMSMDAAVVALSTREMNLSTTETPYAAINYSTFAAGSRTIKTQVFSETASVTTGYAYRGIYVLDLRETPNISVSVTGVAAVGAVGTALTTAKATTTTTGVAAVGAVGTVSMPVPISVSVTGVEAAGLVGPTFVDYQTVLGDGTDGTSFTFSSVPFGAAYSGRLVVVAIGARALLTSGRITGVTIGGVSATQLVSYSGAGVDGQYPFDIWAATVPSGATGTVAVTYNQTMREAWIAVWSAYDMLATPYDTLAVTTGGGIDTKAGGVLIAAFYGDADPSHTLTGVTEEFDETPTGTTYVDAGGSLSPTATSTGHTVSTSDVGSFVLAVSLEPVGSPTGLAVTAKANVPPTGVSAIGYVGTAFGALGISAITTGVAAVGAVGTALTTAKATTTTTGAEATGSVGTALTTAAATTTTTGVNATGSVGTVLTTAAATTTTTGVEAVGYVGEVTVTAAAGGDIDVDATGVEAIGSVGTVLTTAKATTTTTGVEATGSVGTVFAAANSNTPVTGVNATGSVGTVVVTAAATTAPTGVDATGSVGTTTVDTATRAIVTGVEATGSVGTVVVTAKANVFPTGVDTTGSVGTVTTTAAATTTPTGVNATGSVGTVAATAPSIVYISGVQAVGAVSQVLVWGPVPPVPPASWTPVNETQGASWVQVNDGNTVTWVEVPT